MATQLILKFKNYTSRPISEGRIKIVLLTELKKMGKEGIFEISTLICGNRRIQSLNQKYRGVDRPTDVLSFGQINVGKNNSKPRMLGDIVISAEYIQSQALEYRVSFEQEFDKMLIHGLKHLLGIHHK